MVGPIGPSGPPGPIAPLAPPSGGSPDTLGGSSSSSLLVIPPPSQPSLFPPISDLADIIGILNDLAHELEDADTQRAAISRDLYSSIALSLSNDLPQLEEATDQFIKHLNLHEEIRNANNAIQPFIDIENNLLTGSGGEQEQAAAINSAINNYNAAATDYQNLVDNEPPLMPPAPHAQWVIDRDAAYVEMENKRGLLIAAKTTYNSYVATRNSGIAAYNALQTTYASDLPGFNTRLDEINTIRAGLDLPPLGPSPLTGPEAKPLMDTFDTDVNALMVPLGDDAIFVTETENPRTDASFTISDTENIPEPDPAEFVLTILQQSLLIFNQALVAGRIADYSRNLFDFLYFNLKANLDPTQLDAITDRLPPVTTQSEQSSDAGVTTPGSGVALASQVIGLSNPDLESIMSNGIAKAAAEEESTPLSTELAKLLQLLVFKLLSINSAASAKPSVARLGIHGVNLAGNRQSVQATSAVGQLENILGDVSANRIKEAVTLLLNSQPGLSQEQVQNLVDPTVASLNFGMILVALNNVGRTIGAPALVGDLLSAAFANDPNFGEIFDISTATTTDDVIRNSLAQVYLRDALIGEISKITGAPRADAARIANNVINTVAVQGNLSQQDLESVIAKALEAAGINADVANTLAGALALRVISEVELSNQLQNLQLDSIVNGAQINTDSIISKVLNSVTETNKRISDAIAAGAEETAQVRERLAKEAIRSGIQNGAQLTRQIREDIINQLIDSGVGLNLAANIANETIRQIDAVTPPSNQNLARLSGTQRSLEEVRADIRSNFITATQGDLGGRADKIADALDKAIFGPTQRLPEREKDEIRNPISVVNQVRDQLESLTRGHDSRVADEITEAVRKASQANYDVNRMQNLVNDPGTFLTHSILTGISGSDAALPATAASKPAAPIGKNIDIPA